MAPVLVRLQGRIAQVEAAVPATPLQRSTKERLLPMLVKSLEALRLPDDPLEAPGAAVEPLKQAAKAAARMARCARLLVNTRADR